MPDLRHDTDSTAAAPTRSPALDGRFVHVPDLLLAQDHQRSAPPVEGHGRWPISVLLMPAPSDPVTLRLDAFTRQAAELAGHDQWRTGRMDSAHLTVRALENYRESVPQDDAAVARYRTALDRAAGLYGPVTFRVRGLVLTPGTVMACAVPTDDRADGLRARVRTELGADAWRERPLPPRDLWYLSLLHFTGDIDDPGGLADWVAGHRDTDFGALTIAQLSLARFRLVAGPEPRMQPLVLSAHTLSHPAGDR